MIRKLSRTRARCDRPRAQAAVLVEFAVVLPLLLTILFGIIEYGWIFMVRQTVQNAAREGCRIAVLQTSTEPYTDVETRIDQVLSPTGLGSYSTVMEHADGLTTCDETITITVPRADVSLMGDFFGNFTSDLVGSCTMRKEGCVEAGS
jgi:hypothetical protein